MVGSAIRDNVSPDGFKAFLFEKGLLLPRMTKEPENYLNALIDLAGSREDFCSSIAPLDADWKDFLEYIGAGRLFPKYEISRDGWGTSYPSEDALKFMFEHPHTVSKKPEGCMEGLSGTFLVLKFKYSWKIHRDIGQLLGSEKPKYYSVEKDLGGYVFLLDYEIEDERTELSLLTRRAYITKESCFVWKCPYRQYIGGK